MIRVINAKYCLLVLFAITFSEVNSQTLFSLKAETGFLYYRFNSIEIESEPGWKGYNLQDQNGFDVNFINGMKLSDLVSAGLGIAYMNFEGMPGCAVFSDLELSPFERRWSPFVDLRFGYSHIWNQYDMGTVTTLAEISAGISYRIKDNLNIYLKMGFLNTQQSILIPIRIGIKL